MIWRIDDTDVYLIGSCHVLAQADYPLHGQVERVYADSSCIVFEADTSAPELQSFGFYSDGRSFRHHSPDLLRDTVKAFRDLGLDESSVERSKPWRSAFALVFSWLEMQGLLIRLGVDAYFRERTLQDRKEISYLEKPCASLECFDIAPLEVQLNFLESIVRDKEAQILSTHRIVNAWRERNANEIETILDECVLKFPEIFDCLIAGRNQGWTHAISALARKSAQTAVIVGVLHCVGESGLPRMLERQGLHLLRIE